MPIKPENRSRYPADWKRIRERILLRAAWRCEQPGCKAHDGAIGYWHSDEWVLLPHALWAAGARQGTVLNVSGGGTTKVIKIVLTIAHLDHTPENCADDNLRALCQRHHLRLDSGHHAATARATRRARMAAGDLFDAA